MSSSAISRSRTARDSILERGDFLTTNPEKNFDGSDFTGGTKRFKGADKDTASRLLFRPSDICVGADGALYVTDWTDPRVGGHSTLDEAASGVIYRIAPTRLQARQPVHPNRRCPRGCRHGLQIPGRQRALDRFPKTQSPSARPHTTRWQRFSPIRIPSSPPAPSG